MTANYTMINVIVSDIKQLTPLIKQFTFKKTDGTDFPPFSGGSHIIVKMNDRLSNAYSLMGSKHDLSEYKVCVRLEENGKGGSQHLHHHIAINDELQISSPNNLFALSPNANRHVLIAGGIGITPFVPQLQELAERQCDFELHYAFRALEHGALWEELNQTYPNQCHAYINALDQSLNIAELVRTHSSDTHFYVCGPKSLIDATIAACTQANIPAEQIHWEQFTSTIPEEAEGFQVILAKSGQTITVEPKQSILDAVEKIGISVECLCREGACGTCETKILAGEAHHYDQYLDDDEKASQQTMLICVSRAKGHSITLDL